VTARPDVSVLIVNWNTRDQVLRCLDSIPGGVNDGLAYELIVVDNGSIDGSAEALAGRPGVKLLRNAENRGYAAAVNQAYRCSGGELVLLLNADVELPRGALSGLARFLRSHPQAAGVGPLYLNPDGSLQPFHFALPTLGMLVASNMSVLGRLPPLARRLRDYRIDEDGIHEPRPVPQPSASCLLLRRSALPGRRVFDERFPIFFNDVMLARSLAEQGRQLWVTSDVTVIHDGHASTRQLGRSEFGQQYLGSVVRMLADTGPAYRVWLFRALAFPYELARYAARRPRSIPPRALWSALGGDVGALPSRGPAAPGPAGAAETQAG